MSLPDEPAVAGTLRTLQPLQLPLRGLQLIEASAGTGKTWTIALLYLRLVLEDGHAVESLLVVTFTKAAAAELRDRIRQRLVEALATLEGRPDRVDPILQQVLAQASQRSGEDHPGLARRLRAALQCFDQAAIFTIHGFCQRALADAPFVAGVPLRTELLASDDDLRLEVVQDWWRRAVAGGDLPLLLLQTLQRQADTPQQFADLLKRVQAKPLALERWGAIDALPDGAGALATLAAAWADLQRHWPAALAVLPDAFDRALPALNGASFKLATVDAAFTNWAALLAGGDPWACPDAEKAKLHLLRRDLVVAKKTARQPPPMPDHPFLDAVQAFLEARAVCATLGDAWRRRLLRDMLATCGPALRARKREQHVQAFDDMLYDLHAVLAGARGDALAENLRQRFPVALVDEFQDTDPLQWRILQRIYAGSTLPRLLVGDPKQAIYRFRNADLPTYLAARATVPPEQRHTLLHNQRSCPALIDACNALFASNPRCFIDPDLAYVQVARGSKPLAVLHDPAAAAGAAAALQVWLLPRDGAGAPLALDPARACAATACANEIVLLLQGAQAGAVRLGEAPLPTRQIAVLVQSHQQGRLVRAVLEAQGVPCVERSQASIFAGTDARDLLRLLAAIAEPGDAGLVAAALATVWLGQTAAGIDELRQREQGLASVMADLADALQRWRTRGFAVMMRRLLERYGVQARLLAQPDGPRRLTNLRHLLELLQGAARLQPGPAALLAWLRQRVDQPGVDDEAQLRLESDAERVQIVTVHAAKGLEYAVVFCPFFWVNSAGRPESGFDCIEYPSAVPGEGLVRDFRSPAERDGDAAMIQAQRQEASEAERLRLLYVALTRAAQRCYLVVGAYASGKGKAGVPNVRKAATSPVQWLVSGAGQTHAAWRDAPAADAAAIDAAWPALAARTASTDAIGVAVLATGAPQVLRLTGHDPASLQALVSPRPVPPRQRIGSYSGLLAAAAAHAGPVPGAARARSADGGDPSTSAAPGVPGGSLAPAEDHDTLPVLSATIDHAFLRDAAGRDHDRAVVPAAPAAEATPAGVRAADILQFPRGADAGTVLHGVLEVVDFQSPAQWPTLVSRVLAREGVAAEQAPRVLGMLQDLVATRLPAGFRLADVARTRCRAELEFHLPAPRLAADRLRGVLARHGHASPDLQFPVLHGHLKGFMDLVLEHDGRWYVVDWKSNHLGDTPAAYGPAALAAAVARHDYGLQALLYLLALDRLLARRLAGYRRELHLGGALYLFVRGVRPSWQDAAGGPTGVWWQPADASALDDLAAALDGSSDGCAAGSTGGRWRRQGAAG